MQIIAEPTPFLEPRFCSEWFALIGQIGLLCVLARAKPPWLRALYCTIHNLYCDETPFGSAKFKRLVNDCTADQGRAPGAARPVLRRLVQVQGLLLVPAVHEGAGII
jgi:hypothetical protein